jgi:hypothetical protein
MWTLLLGFAFSHAASLRAVGHGFIWRFRVPPTDTFATVFSSSRWPGLVNASVWIAANVLFWRLAPFSLRLVLVLCCMDFSSRVVVRFVLPFQLYADGWLVAILPCMRLARSLFPDYVTDLRLYACTVRVVLNANMRACHQQRIFAAFLGLCAYFALRSGFMVSAFYLVLREGWASDVVRRDLPPPRLPPLFTCVLCVLPHPDQCITLPFSSAVQTAGRRKQKTGGQA